jgi:Fe-S cluster biosynthesis and repair protein YggX
MKKKIDIISEIKKLQKETVHKLHEKMETYKHGEVYILLQNASAGMSQSINKRKEEIEMERKLKFELISQEEYENWKERQNKLNMMNEEIRKEQEKRTENFEKESDIMCLAFHVSYMLNAYSNPKFNKNELFFNKNWKKFNDLLKKYKIQNEPYIITIINDYKLKETNAIRTNSILKIGFGALIIILWFSFFVC